MERPRLQITLTEIFFLVFLAALCCAIWTASLKSGSIVLAVAGLISIGMGANVVLGRRLVSFWTLLFIAFILPVTAVVFLAVIVLQIKTRQP